MKPKPLASLNHFTVPVVVDISVSYKYLRVIILTSICIKLSC
jgi:hypothetical protein